MELLGRTMKVGVFDVSRVNLDFNEFLLFVVISAFSRAELAAKQNFGLCD